MMLNVSKEGILKSLADQFTSTTTFINELLQNARRAGASHIDINVEGHLARMTITDNGAGIKDFASLFTIGQSGWEDLAILDKERPFGIGFASAIFAADHVDIKSGTQHVSFFTDDLLALKPVIINECVPVRGTVVTLLLAKQCRYLAEYERYAREDQLQAQELIEKLVKGFPVSVWYNRQELKRPHAMDNGLPYLSRPYGELYISDNNIAWSHDVDATVYLQGFAISTSTSGCVMHLDSRQFRARVPDRDKLIDHDATLKQIRKWLREDWQLHLGLLKYEMEPQEFVNRYYETCRAVNSLYIMDNMPLPSDSSVIYNEPARHETYDGDLKDNVLEVVDVIQPGEVCLLGELDDFGDNNGLVAAYVSVTKMKVLRTVVSDKHWAQGSCIESDELEVGIELENPRKIGNGVTLCDSYTLIPKDPRLEPVTEYKTCIYDGQYVVPAGATRADGTVNYDEIYSVLLQERGFTDENGDIYNELSHLTAVDDMCQYINAHVVTGPELVLKNLIEGAPNYIKDLLKGRSFMVYQNEPGRFRVEAA
jgi:hypothetical protein